MEGDEHRRHEQEIEQLRSALTYERQQRYAAEMALHDTQEVGRIARPEQRANDEFGDEQWPD